jgi:transposase
MGAVVELRQDFGADDLRQFARFAKTGAQAGRLLALAGVLDGMSRAEAARIGGMDRQTLRDWAHRFNQYGPDGLVDIKPPGRRPRLSDEQKDLLKRLVDDGPDPETDGVVRWRCVDLKRVVRDRFGVDLSEVSLGRILKQLGFSRISARPQHPMQDPEAIEAFKKRYCYWPGCEPQRVEIAGLRAPAGLVELGRGP